jgi:radical SAM superfamily enzyme YgiQ (UPF0313 family)
VSGVQYTGIASLSAHAKRAGHDIVFFDTACYSSHPQSSLEYKDCKSRIDLEFRQIKDKSTLPDKRPISTLLLDLEQVIRSGSIDIIGFSTFSDDWPFTLFLIKKVRSIAPDMPIIVGGIHASLVPEQVMAHPEVDMVCVGEGEAALVELLNAIEGGCIKTSVENIWAKKDGVLLMNRLRPLTDFEKDTPMLDWTSYTDMHFYYPFEGKLYRRGSVSLGRGCPYSCNFCINDALRRRYPGSGNHFRVKSVAYVIKEIAYLAEAHNLEFLRFWDETFLAMPPGYIAQFATAYKREIALPFTIETTAQTMNRENARMLTEMGCQSVSVGVETSNETLRMKILNKPTRNEAYEKCFAVLTEYGIRKVGNFMFFLPHQTLDDMWNDVRISARWKIDHASARIFYPYPGTGMREYCLKNDMINLSLLKEYEDENSVQSIDDLGKSYLTFRDTVLNVDNVTRKAGRMILDNFVLFQETDPGRHKWLSESLDGSAGVPDEVRELEHAIYKKKFGEEFFTGHEE